MRKTNSLPTGLKTLSSGSSPRTPTPQITCQTGVTQSESMCQRNNKEYCSVYYSYRVSNQNIFQFVRIPLIEPAFDLSYLYMYLFL